MREETDTTVPIQSWTRSLLRDHGLEATVVFGAIVFLALTVAADFSAVTAALREFDWAMLLVVVALTSIGFVFRFLKWEYCLRHLGIRVPVVSSALVFVSGLLMTITPMKGGGVWKGWLLRDTEGVPISRVVSVVVVERATDLLALSAIASIGIVLYNRSPGLILGVIAVFVGVIVVIQWRRFCIGVLEWFQTRAIIGDYVEPLITTYEDSYELFQLRPLLVTFGFSCVAWVIEGMSLWVVLRGLGVTSEPLLALSVFGFGSVVGGVSMLPGGVGAAEASISGVLVAFGIQPGVAASATMLVRFGTLWYGAALGAVGFAVFKLWHKELKLTDGPR